MVRRIIPAFAIALFVAACSSTDIGPYALTDDDKAKQVSAAGKTMCAIENRARCDHLIENRLLFGRFFAPETLGGMDEAEKLRGRSVTTKFVVEAVAEIKQCNRINSPSIPIVKGMDIAGGKYTVMGTSPLLEGESTCFITPQVEG